MTASFLAYKSIEDILFRIGDDIVVRDADTLRKPVVPLEKLIAATVETAASLSSGSQSHDFDSVGVARSSRQCRIPRDGEGSVSENVNSLAVSIFACFAAARAVSKRDGCTKTILASTVFIWYATSATVELGLTPVNILLDPATAR